MGNGIASMRKRADLRGKRIDDEWTQFAAASGSLGVPRIAMPQIAAENRGAMVRFLNARGIEHHELTVPADALRPTQLEFSEAKVRKAKRFAGGNRAILASTDGHVLDGHHQWVAAHDQGEEIRVIALAAPVGRLINALRDMPSITTADGETSPLVVVGSAPKIIGIGALMGVRAKQEEDAA